MKTLLLSLSLLLPCLACSQDKLAPARSAKPAYQSATLTIAQLTPKTYVHISYYDIPNYGPYPCNGLVFVDDQEAIVFDTPTTDSVSLELIRWIEQELQAEVKAVVATHFHEDCLGGLKAFHQKGIPSYANHLTIELAKREEAELPKAGFDQSLELEIGTEKVDTRFFGEGHSPDNIVGYIPGEKVLFGGCLIKEVGAGKGNLSDANTEEWPETVRKIKQAYPDLKYVVPGHGKVGGVELLDYTIYRFEE